MTTAANSGVRHDLKLTMQEVVAFFAVAWETATDVLPSVLADDTSIVCWADLPTVDLPTVDLPTVELPTVELRLVAETRIDAPQLQPVLDDFIDMSPLGSSDRGQLREMAVTITAPPIVDPSDRQRQTRRALAYMAQQFGFLDATEDRL